MLMLYQVIHVVNYTLQTFPKAYLQTLSSLKTLTPTTPELEQLEGCS